MNRETAEPQGARGDWREIALLLEQADHAAAEALCREALQRGESDPTIRLGLAMALLQRGASEEAVVEATYAAAMLPRDPRPFHVLASAHAARGDRKAAVDAAMMGLRIAPSPASRDLLRQVREWCEDAGEGLSDRTVIATPVRELTGTSIPAIQALAPPVSTASPSQADADLIDRQVAALFGQSLFGDLADPGLPSAESVSRSRRSPRLFLGLLALAVLAAAVAAIVLTGLERRGLAAHARIADELLERLEAGDLTRLSALLHSLAAEDAAGFLAYPDLRLRAEATLYRYADAEPARLERIEAGLRAASGPPGYDRVVARALIAAEVERLGMLGELRRVDTPENRDPEAAFLLGTTLARAGEAKAAIVALSRAGDLGPGHLQHQFLAAVTLARLGQRLEARRTLEALTDQSPRSFWTGLGRRVIEGSAEGLTPDTPVGWSALRFNEALSARGAAARKALVQALEAVHAGPAFVIDLADRLLQADRPPEVRALIARPTWPRDRPGALAVEGCLLLTEGKPAEARPALLSAWQQGVREPRTGLCLIALGGAGAFTADGVLAELLEHFPGRVDLEVEAARQQSLGEGVVRAAERIRRRLSEIQAEAPRPVRATAYLVLARAKASQGKLDEARALCKAALSWDKDNAEVRALLEQMESRKSSRRRRQR